MYIEKMRRELYQSIASGMSWGFATIPLFFVVVSIYSTDYKACGQGLQEDLILSPDPISGERFGGAIAIDGDTAVIGASGNIQENIMLKGRAFVYLRTGNRWRYQATLSYAGSLDGDAFGNAVAIAGDSIVIGSPHPLLDDTGRSGRVLLYKRPQDGWHTTNNPDGILLPDDGNGNETFGSAVGISFVDGSAKPWIIVGAAQDDRTAHDAGSVYIFRALGSTYRLMQIIEQPQPDWNENFGNSLAMDEDFLVVGAPSLPHSKPGSVHTYQLSANGIWEHQQSIVGFDTVKGDHFGRSLGLWRDDQNQNGWLVIGATGDDDFGEHSGSAYIYQWVRGNPKGGWQFFRKFTDPDSRHGDHVGFSSTVIGDVMAIGAPFPGMMKNNILYIMQYQPELQQLDLIAEHEATYPDSLGQMGMAMQLFKGPKGAAAGLMAGISLRNINGIADAGAVLVLSQ